MTNETHQTQAFVQILFFRTHRHGTVECDLPILERQHKNFERTNCSSELPIQWKPTRRAGFELSQRPLRLRIALRPVLRSSSKEARLSTHSLEAASLKS